MAARRFRRALHKIKAANDLSGADRVVLQKLLYPVSGDNSRTAKLRDILERTRSRAHVTCFWRGDPGEPAPEVPDCVKSTIHPLATAIETDFAVAGSRRTVA